MCYAGLWLQQCPIPSAPTKMGTHKLSGRHQLSAWQLSTDTEAPGTALLSPLLFTFPPYLLQLQKGHWVSHTHRGVQFNSTARSCKHRAQVQSRVSRLLWICRRGGWDLGGDDSRGAYEHRGGWCQAGHTEIRGGSSREGAVGNWGKRTGERDEREGSQGCWWHHDTRYAYRRQLVCGQADGTRGLVCREQEIETA